MPGERGQSPRHAALVETTTSKRDDLPRKARAGTGCLPLRWQPGSFPDGERKPSLIAHRLFDMPACKI